MKYVFIIAAITVISCNKITDTLTSRHASTAIIRADRGDVLRTVISDGVLYSPESKPVIVPRIRWYWELNVAWTIEEGSTVKAGDVIARLDPSIVRKDLEEAKSTLDSARLTFEERKVQADERLADALTAIKTTEFSLKKAKLNVVNDDSISAMERKRQLIDVASAEATMRRTQEQMEATKASNNRTIEVEKLNLKQKENDYNELLLAIDKMEIKAPQDGVVYYPPFATGASSQKLRPGITVRVNSTIAEVAQPTKLVARAFVPEVDMSGINIGTQANVSVEIHADELVPGTVTLIGRVPSTIAERENIKSQAPEQNLRQIEVQITLDRLPKDAMPGLTTRILLEPTAKRQVLRVPIELLSKTNTENDHSSIINEILGTTSGSKLYVKTRENARAPWHWQEVSVGAVSYLYAEILSGINEGSELQAAQSETMEMTR